MTSSDLEKRDARSQIWGISIITLVWFDLEIGIIKHVREKYVSRYVSRKFPRPIPRGGDPASPN